MYRKEKFRPEGRQHVVYEVAEDKLGGNVAAGIGAAAIAGLGAFAYFGDFHEAYGETDKMTAYKKAVDAAYADRKMDHNEGMSILDRYAALDASQRGDARWYYMKYASPSKALCPGATSAKDVCSKSMTGEESLLAKEMKDMKGLYDYKYDVQQAYRDKYMTRQEFDDISQSHDVVPAGGKQEALDFYTSSVWNKAPAFVKSNTSSYEYRLLRKIASAASPNK